ncbi:MAG: PCMD domain-containing protein [Muribaculaceae bacterium]|nr:PCMD domain-containing protein [Muribaculaceae bacterium]
MSAYKRIFPLLAAVILTAMTGCIKNNIPYPHLKVSFTSFEVEGLLEPAAIDTIARTVTFRLDESADIEDVVVNGFTISPSDAVWSDSVKFLNGVNLSEPVVTTLSLYQDYSWTISAVQEIERYFTVEQQVGAAVIDVPGRRVIAYVSASAPISDLTVTSIKLGATGSVMEPDLEGRKYDFSSPVEVSVTDHGRTVVWTIYVLTTESAVTTESVDPWSCVAWLYGSGEAGKDNGFEYRLTSSTEWTRLPASAVTHDGGAFTGRLTGLSPETSYVARAYSGNDYGAEIEFTTQGVAQMPNSDFENWWLDGKVWDPWSEGGTPYWDTGNKGATTLGSSNTYPSDDTPTGRGRSACLETRFVGIGMIGKLAAGNIFAGSYLRTDGTNGVLSFGREFNLRPTRLRGWFKYHPAPISSTTTGFEDLKGTTDKGIIWVALIDADEPFELRTNPKNRKLFDRDAPDVVAYGEVMWDSDVTEWSQFELTLTYNSTSRVPHYILCTSSASWLGDYFTGGNGSILYLDDLELLYDY